MCTLIVVKPDSPNLPTYILGNRDERLDRASSKFHYRRGRTAGFWAPTDLEKGGTWIGLNDAGLFVGITNRYSPDGYPMADGHVSRGALPALALGERSSTEAILKVKGALKEHTYPGFHLLLVTSSSIDLLIWDGATLKDVRPERSHMVVTERSFSGEQPPERESVIYSQLRDTSLRPGARQLLTRHDANSIDATCVHLDGVNYGTRSATEVELGATINDTRVWETDGPPCTSEWQEVTLVTESMHDI